MSVKIDPEGPRRSKKDPVRLKKLRQTSQAAFAASSYSSWLVGPKGDLKPFVMMYLGNKHNMSLVAVTFGNIFLG